MAKKRKKPTKKKAKMRIIIVRLSAPSLVRVLMQDPSLIWKRDRR